MERIGTDQILERASSQEGGSRELPEARPTGDIERCPRVWFDAGLGVMITKGLVDAGKRCFLIRGAGSLPIEAKTLITDGAMNIGLTVRGITQDLHRDSCP